MSPVTIARPGNTEYAPHYGDYVSAVPDGDVIDLLQRQIRETTSVLGRIDEAKSRFRYAPGKWSIREVVGHLSDAERGFTYRALRFARSDATPLPPFDENAWAEVSNADQRPLRELTAEFEAVRGATLALFRGFTPEEFARAGTASGHHITVRALAYITAGHERHHLNVLRERYGI